MDIIWHEIDGRLTEGSKKVQLVVETWMPIDLRSMQVSIELIDFHAKQFIDIKTCENLKLFYRDMLEYGVLKISNLYLK